MSEGAGDCLTKAPVELLTRVNSGMLVATAMFGEALMALENVVTVCKELYQVIKCVKLM